MGQVVEATVETVRDSESGNRYEPRILYRYRVGRVEYEGTRISVGASPSMASEAEAQALVADLLSRPTVRVHYDPTTPSDAVLVPGTPSSAYATLVFAFVWWVFLLGFIAMLFSGSFGATHEGIEHIE